MFVLRFNKLSVCFLFQFKDTSTSMIPCRINKIWVYKSIALKICRRVGGGVRGVRTNPL